MCWMSRASASTQGIPIVFFSHSNSCEKVETKWPHQKPMDCIMIHKAQEHNLKGIDVKIPLGMLVCITGVSGAGKTTLVHNILYAGAKGNGNSEFEKGAFAPLESTAIHGSDDINKSSTFLQDIPAPGTATKKVLDKTSIPHRKGGIKAPSFLTGFDSIGGVEQIDDLILVDQSPLGRSLRSNSATYIKVFGEIRDLFPRTRQAQKNGPNPRHFSFNTEGGR